MSWPSSRHAASGSEAAPAGLESRGDPLALTAPKNVASRRREVAVLATLERPGGLLRCAAVQGRYRKFPSAAGAVVTGDEVARE